MNGPAVSGLSRLWEQQREAWLTLLRAAKGWLGPLLPPEASSHAERVDILYVFLLAMSACFLIAIAGFNLAFLVKYAKHRDAARSGAPDSSLALEIAWTLIPLGLSACIFVWGARVYLDAFAPSPASAGGSGAEAIFVVGRQWMWKVQHPQGPREIDALHVPAGRPIRLVLASEDVIHSFSVPALRIKRDAVPGRYTNLWFQASRPGRYPIYCSEYCGTQHSLMRAELVVLEPAGYAAWLAQGGGSPAVGEGEKLFASLGCGGCHRPPGSGPGAGPALEGLFGKPVPLAGGSFVLADEAYLRESIDFPARKLAAGYAPLMPAYAGRIREEQMMELIAYLRGLGAARVPENP